MAPRELYSCPKCQRHLFTYRESCPFCDQASDQRPQSRLGAGLLALGLGIGISGCEQEIAEEEAQADMLLTQPDYGIAAEFGPEPESDREPAVPPYGSPALDQDLPALDMALAQPAYGSPELIDFMTPDQGVADQEVADQGEADQGVAPEVDREPPAPPYGSPALDRGPEE